MVSGSERNTQSKAKRITQRPKNKERREYESTETDSASRQRQILCTTRGRHCTCYVTIRPEIGVVVKESYWHIIDHFLDYFWSFARTCNTRSALKGSYTASCIVRLTDRLSRSHWVARLGCLSQLCCCLSCWILLQSHPVVQSHPRRRVTFAANHFEFIFAVGIRTSPAERLQGRLVLCCRRHVPLLHFYSDAYALIIRIR